MICGHFFCSFCNDVVNLRFTGDKVDKCPVCGHNSAEWVPHVRRRNGRVAMDLERGKKLFQLIKEKLPAYEQQRFN